MTESPETPVTTPDDGEMLSTSEAVRRTLLAVSGCGVVLVVGALLWGGARPAMSAAAGAALAVGNLYVLARTVVALLSGGSQMSGWGVVGLLKLIVLFGGVWSLFRAGVVDVLPFAIGFGALPLGVTLGPLFLLKKS